MMGTPDLNAERLRKLRELFPDLFTTEGRLNDDELKKIVDPELVKESERFEFEFRWFGKSGAKRNAFTPSQATLLYDEGRSLHPEHADGNMIIEGENLETMKLLLSAYRGRVKCIYIDPPYNTGNDFVYSDKWDESKQDYWEHIGVTSGDGIKLESNPEASGRFHSNWLNMMYPRLLLARQLLREDGVIFISIDDNEVHNLRAIMNEVFGEGHVEIMIWEKVGDGGAGAGKMKLTKRFRLEHEYIVVGYRDKTLSTFKKYTGYPNFKKYSGNPDNDPRGIYKLGNMSQTEAKSNPKHKHYYTVKSPTGKTYIRQWHFERSKFDTLNKDGRIYWGKDGNAAPMYKIFKDEKKEITPTSILIEKGSATMGNHELERVLNGQIFENPKPSKL